MAISSAISRLKTYYARHGFGETVCRLSLSAKRALFSSRMVLFCCDLSRQNSATADLPSTLTVERCKNQTDLSLRDLQAITSFWNPKLARRNIEHRFGLGATIWLIKVEDKLAGYGWTLRGRTVEPHYFRLEPDDVHLFDFHVFPQYRGQGVNPSLVSYILCCLAGECEGRAFIEAAEWNQAQLASLRRTPFHRLGSARKLTLFRHTLVCWDEGKTVAREQKDGLENTSIPTTDRKPVRVPDLRS